MAAAKGAETNLLIPTCVYEQNYIEFQLIFSHALKHPSVNAKGKINKKKLPNK